MIRLGVIAILLAGCAAVRTAPVGTIAPDPARPGAYVMNPELEQPTPADYQPGGGGFVALLGSLLPQPWGTILTGLATALVAMPIARRAPLRALRQTVNAIESAKTEHPEGVPTLHAALDSAQDEDTKRMVWEMRP